MIQRVKIHYLDTNQPLARDLMQEVENWLDKEELTRRDRLLRPSDRIAFVLSHAFTRKSLGDILGLHPKDIHLIQDNRGKPKLAPLHGCPSLSFNLSHTHGLAAIAIGEDELGLDVENKETQGSDIDIAKHFFSAHEYQEIIKQPAACHSEHLLLYWTLKEAFLKAEGWGILEALDSFEFHIFDQKNTDSSTEINISPTLRSEQISLRILDERIKPTRPWIFWHTRLTNRHLMSLAVAPRSDFQGLCVKPRAWMHEDWLNPGSTLLP